MSATMGHITEVIKDLGRWKKNRERIIDVKKPDNPRPLDTRLLGQAITLLEAYRELLRSRGK